MKVEFHTQHIRDLAIHLEDVPNRATDRVRGAVESVAKEGLKLAQTFATESAGRHGKWYPKSMTAESEGVNRLTWVYGPDSAKRQGGMSFEWGSRHQKPHLDLNKSADIIGPLLERKIDDAIRVTFDE